MQRLKYASNTGQNKCQKELFYPSDESGYHLCMIPYELVTNYCSALH